MTYQYRNIHAVFEPIDGSKCRYSFYIKREGSDVFYGRGAVCVGIEVTDLSRCALEEFARKYIDVKYGSMLHTYLAAEVPKTDIPLSLAALEVASDIQRAANFIVDYCKDEHGFATECEYKEIAEGAGVKLSCIEDYCDAIERAVKEMTDGKVIRTECTFIVELPQGQNESRIQQTPPIQMM